jgi:hypothetical protein
MDPAQAAAGRTETEQVMDLAELGLDLEEEGPVVWYLDGLVLHMVSFPGVG